MFSRFYIIFLFVNIFSDVLALIELPQVEENNILEADTAIRQTTNKLFSLLNLKVNKDWLNLQQYSLIHNYLVSTSLHDYTNLKEIAKLTRVDKTRLNNETHDFMAIVNEILNEDIKHDTVNEDEYVVRHIEGFLTNLDKFIGKYEYSENNADFIIAEIYNILEKNNTISEALNKSVDPDTNRLESSDENEFWVPNARRIFQGKRSTIKDFPFMASIQVFNHFQCAGSIIKSDLIITAASCLQLTWNNRFFRENPSFLTARVGSSFHNVGGENVQVLEIYFHPEYEPKSLRNNLCLLRLHRHLKFMRKKGKRVKKIEIDRKPNPIPVTTLVRGNIDITIVGWGAQGVSPVVKDQYMTFAVLDIYPVHDCQAVYSAEYVTHKHFCAGFLSRGGGACNRDIGGPGILNGILVGVISFGSAACGTPDAPTVFTKLGYYYKWIDSIIEQKVPVSNKRTTLTTPYEFTMPYEYSTAKTIIKIKPPVFAKKTVKERDQIEILRALKAKGLLKEFIDTVIGSEEAQELLVEAEKATDSITNAPVTVLDPLNTDKNTSEGNLRILQKSSSETIEKLSELESNETIDANIEDKALENQIEKDIMEIIDNMNSFMNDSRTADVQKLENKQQTNSSETKNLHKVLKFSEEDDSTDTSSDKSNEDGIEIPVRSTTHSLFSDPLTYRNNGSEPDIFLSKQDLIDLFSETIKEEFQIATPIEHSSTTPRKRLLKSEPTQKAIVRKNTIKMHEKSLHINTKKPKKKSVYRGK